MKILFVAPRLPWPVDTGAKIRTFNLLKEIVNGNQVTLLSFCFKDDQRAVNELKNLGIEVYLINATDKINFLKLFSKLPVIIEKYGSKKLAAKCRELLSKEKFDLVHFDHLHMGQYQDCAKNLPCVLDEHNVESIILKRCADVEKNIIKRMIFKSQAKKLSRYEGALVSKFSKCLVVSESDKQNLYELSGRKANIEVIPNGVDTEYFNLGDSPLRGQSPEDALVFTGSMDWLPNADAAIYFTNEIMPLIWEKNPQIKFYIVGKNPSQDVKDLGIKDSRIIVTGSVPDVRPYMVKSKIFVVPLRIGGGTRLKILEAMSMSKTIVSTTVGAEGIDYTPDKNIVIKDKPREFANMILSLLKDKTKQNALGISGREMVCNNYDWKIIGNKLKDIYRNIT